jgi:GNAT superfamily N-acetyltransferase
VDPRDASGDLSVTLTDTPDPALRDVITAIFTAEAEAKGIARDFRPLAVEVKRDGVMLGGLWGRTGRGWLHVELLAVPRSEQGTGLGTRLLEMAEAEALARGCKGSFLNTIQFQAPDFYRQRGYTEVGRIPDDPAAHDRIWFVKRFARE